MFLFSLLSFSCTAFHVLSSKESSKHTLLRVSEILWEENISVLPTIWLGGLFCSSFLLMHFNILLADRSTQVEIPLPIYLLGIFIALNPFPLYVMFLTRSNFRKTPFLSGALWVGEMLLLMQHLSNPRCQVTMVPRNFLVMPIRIVELATSLSSAESRWSFHPWKYSQSSKQDGNALSPRRGDQRE